MKLSPILAATAASLLVTTAQAATCNADNCLRGLRNSAIITRAVAFCSTYTAAGAPTTAALPTYASVCSNSPARVSSACACLSLSTTPTPTPTPTNKPSTPVTCPTLVSVSVSVSTTTVTSVTTVKDSGATPVAGPPGASHVPNGLFESGDGSTDWCRNNERSTCRIVQESADGSFTGIYGAGMLFMSLKNENFVNFAVPVPAVMYPNPAGRDWTLTALYRTKAGNPGRCVAILGWLSPSGGSGNWDQFNFPSEDGWQSFKVTLPRSAGGTQVLWSIFLIAGCQSDDEGMYIDGVALS
ncbi:hypothetical protein ACHAQA_007491 [Verticillium albo-atrum]